jgi:bifunctional N-acetylglucosamine-1-phosphate-uridyltransferase/glucosamine-1-phosphate-acetyltransferase GlmU-like protein
MNNKALAKKVLQKPVVSNDANVGPFIKLRGNSELVIAFRDYL